MELEAIVVPSEERQANDDSALSENELEILRLELVLLLDACQSIQLRSQLSNVQRFSLQKTLGAVLGELNADSDKDAQQDVVCRAQNRLFDALHERCAGHLHSFADASIEYA